MTPWLKRIFPGIAASLIAVSAWPADGLLDLPLERLMQLEVAGASGFSQALTDAPSAVSIITAEDIRRYGYRNIGEALQSVRGVYTTNGRDYTYIGIRGFARPGDYNSRLLLLSDGIRRNDPIYDTAPIGSEAPIDIDWIKQLEFVPGPASALYGANAIFGVANAVLWSGADLSGSRVAVEAGSGNTARVSLMSGRRTAEGSDWVFGVSALQRRGEDIYFREFDAPGIGNGIAHGLDGERSVKAFAKLASGAWKFDAGFSSRRKEVPTAYYGTSFDTPGTFVQDDYAYADLAHSKILAPDWTQNLRLRAGSYSFAANYVYPGLLNRDEALATWWGLDYQLNYAGFAGHKLLIGAEAQRNPHADQRNFDAAPAAGRFDDRRSGGSTALYVQDEWRIDRRWMTNLGARLDHINGFSAFSPRAALIFHPVPEAALKLMHGRAFRPPNFYERYYNDGNQTAKANPAAQPEHIITDELAADYALSPVMRLAGSLYRYRLHGLIEQVVDPADNLSFYANSTPINAHGLELEAEALLGRGLRLKGSVARQRVVQASGAAPNSPGSMGKVQFDGPLFGSAWLFGLSVNALGPRFGTNGSVPGQVIGNLVLNRKLPKAYGELSVGIYNLAGKHYLDPAFIGLTQAALPQDGRQVRIIWKIAY